MTVPSLPAHGALRRDGPIVDRTGPQPRRRTQPKPSAVSLRLDQRVAITAVAALIQNDPTGWCGGIPGSPRIGRRRDARQPRDRLAISDGSDSGDMAADVHAVWHGDPAACHAALRQRSADQGLRRDDRPEEPGNRHAEANARQPQDGEDAPALSSTPTSPTTRRGATTIAIDGSSTRPPVASGVCVAVMPRNLRTRRRVRRHHGSSSSCSAMPPGRCGRIALPDRGNTGSLVTMPDIRTRFPDAARERNLR
jgi:hypothetical protein